MPVVDGLKFLVFLGNEGYDAYANTTINKWLN